MNEPTFSTPHEISSTMMSPEEARKRVIQINSQINNIRFLVLDFHDREGWRALGYDSWEACIDKEFEQGRRYIFYQLKAAGEEEFWDAIRQARDGNTKPLFEYKARGGKYPNLIDDQRKGKANGAEEGTEEGRGKAGTEEGKEVAAPSGSPAISA